MLEIYIVEEWFHVCVFFNLFANYSLLMLFKIYFKYEEYSWLNPLKSTYFLAPLGQVHTDNTFCHFSEKINKFVGKCSNEIFYFNLPKMVLITTSVADFFNWYLFGSYIYLTTSLHIKKILTPWWSIKSNKV